MRFRYWILAMVVSLLASCSRDDVLPSEGGDEEFSDLVTEVSASCVGFSVGLTRGDDDNDGDDKSDTDPLAKSVKKTPSESSDYILGIKEFKEGDKIYILQRGPQLTPKFPGDFFDHRNDSDEAYEEYRTKNKLDNIYVYEYYEPDSEVSWSNGYNFKLKEHWSDPISWSKVKNNGSIGNSFMFFAFCDNLKDIEPVDDPLLKHWKDAGSYVVAWGPTTYYHHAYGGKWKKSDNVGNGYDYSNDWHVYQYQNHCGVPDFMGAYHSTSTLYSRPRFRFFHLLAYVRVTLYVPVEQEYEDEGPNGEKVTRKNGYDETAFMLTNDVSGTGQGGEINDYRAGVSIGNHRNDNRVLRTRFTIDWSANRSSDNYPPQTQLLDVANSAGFLYYYCMYMHNPLDITDLHYKQTIGNAEKDYEAIRDGIEVLQDFDVTQYVNAKDGISEKYLYKVTEADGSIKYYDKVRRYEFSASMPEQTIPTSGTVGGKTATSTLVDIHVRTAGTEDVSKIANESNQYNNFVEYTLSSKNFIEGANDFALKQGTITHLHIYLPRLDDQAILVKAEVLPWNETHTDMTVAPDEW